MVGDHLLVVIESTHPKFLIHVQLKARYLKKVYSQGQKLPESTKLELALQINCTNIKTCGNQISCHVSSKKTYVMCRHKKKYKCAKELSLMYTIQGINKR